KGIDYEAAVGAAVRAIVEPQGDIVDQVGASATASRRKVGDYVVSLTDAHASGRNGRLLIEAKDRQVKNIQTALEELDAGMLNRDCSAAIMVVSSQENAPLEEPFYQSGTRALVVLDRDDWDDRALRLALHWGRWVVQRQFDPTRTLNAERIDTALARARATL